MPPRGANCHVYLPNVPRIPITPSAGSILLAPAYASIIGQPRPWGLCRSVGGYLAWPLFPIVASGHQLVHDLLAGW
jgi:hypothetical protein